jgi:hypothetical protein
MPERRRRIRRTIHPKSAFVTVQAAELGWSGSAGGRTVSVVFLNGQNRKIGQLEISAARLRWTPAKDKLPYVIKTTDLDHVFWKWHNR